MNKYVTAKQVAEKLLQNPDDIVCVTSDNFEIGNEYLPLESTDFMRSKGEISTKRCRDAFDGTNYSVDIVKLNNKSKVNFIKL